MKEHHWYFYVISSKTLYLPLNVTPVWSDFRNWVLKQYTQDDVIACKLVGEHVYMYDMNPEGAYLGFVKYPS